MMLRLNRLTVSPRAHQRGHGFRPVGELVAVETTHRRIVMCYRCAGASGAFCGKMAQRVPRGSPCPRCGSVCSGILQRLPTPRALQAIEAAGEKLSVELRIVPALTLDEFDGAFSTMTREGVGAFLVVASPLIVAERVLVAQLALKHRLPGMFPFRENVEAGGLMSYGADRDDLYRRAATYVDKILEGVKPADLPVEQASKYQLVINLKTAKALGLAIPPTLLVRADEVIE
jgi:hypothetical protein